MTLPVHSRPSAGPPWEELAKLAACRGLSPDLFVPKIPATITRQFVEQVDETVAICQRCPIQSECLVYGVTYGYVGIWGGQLLGDGGKIHQSRSWLESVQEPPEAPQAREAPEPPAARENPRTRALRQRDARVLELIRSAGPAGMTRSRLLARTGLGWSVSYRTLNRLEVAGRVRREGEPNRWHPPKWIAT